MSSGAVAYLLEAVVVADGRFRVEGGPQMVEQVGRVDEQDRVALAKLMVGDGRRQMGLAASRSRPSG